MTRTTTLGLALGFAIALAGPASAQVKFGMAGPITGPSAATGAQMKNGVDQAAEDLNKTGVTILLVEQNARLALKLASYGYVLETGSIRLSGEADTLGATSSIVEAYLGA